MAGISWVSPMAALAGDGQRIESGLGMDKCPDEGRLDLISLGCRLYGAGVVIEEEACRAPVDLGRRIAGIAVAEQQQFVVTCSGIMSE